MEQHLTLEQLSDLLDEEAPDAVLAHLETCDRCGYAGQRMRSSRDILRDDVTLPPQAIDAAVSGAVAVLTTSNIAPLAGRRRTNLLPWIAGVAAVLVGVLGLAALVNRAGDGQDADTFAALDRGDDHSSEDATVTADGGGTAGGSAGGSTGLDGLAEESAPAAGSQGRTSAAAPPQRAFGSEEEVVDYLRQSADAMSTTATSCSTEAVATLGAPLEQLRSEDVIWQDGPAVLWVDPAQRRAVLMRPAGCSLLADLRY